MNPSWSGTQLPNASSHTTPGPASTQHRAPFLVGETLELAGQPQLQRLAQFVEPHQHPAFILEAYDLLLEPLEEPLRGAAGNLVPIDAGEDSLLEFLAAEVLMERPTPQG
jgi:hypothetical protein